MTDRVTSEPRAFMQLIKAGQELTPTQVSRLRQLLEREPVETTEDVYNALRAFAWSSESSESNIALVEKFLASSDDWARSGAIQALLDFWKLCDRYEALVRSEVSSLKSSEIPSDAATNAVRALGKHLAETQRPWAAEVLLDLWDERTSKLTDDDELGVAEINVYEALSRNRDRFARISVTRLKDIDRRNIDQWRPIVH
jgi:hypothetical protein